jgi:hypothetical protein
LAGNKRKSTAAVSRRVNGKKKVPGRKSNNRKEKTFGFTDLMALNAALCSLLNFKELFAIVIVNIKTQAPWGGKP